MPIPPADSSKKLVNSLISSYYKEAKSIAPEKIEQREFGIGTFESRIAFRHVKFGTEKELRDYLVNNSVPHINCAGAYYKYPDGRPMEAKGWLGSELLFDLDVTDMDLRCQLRHGKSWICQECLNAVKAETIKLIEQFLIPDFGFSEKEISVNFSGNRGYHVRVKKESILKLDTYARNEISNYISGIGIEFDELFPNAGAKGVALKGPRPTDKGWKGKIAKNFISGLHAGESSLMEMGMTKQIASNLFRKKALVELGINSGNWDMVYIKNKAEFWKKIIEAQAVKQSDKIDRNVTNDPSHMLRLPNSIHGETGLIAKKLDSISELYRFEPMRDAIAFNKGDVRIKATSRYEIIMNNDKFGPYTDQEVTVPTYAGMYLYLKGAAEIVSSKG